MYTGRNNTLVKFSGFTPEIGKNIQEPNKEFMLRPDKQYSQRSSSRNSTRHSEVKTYQLNLFALSQAI